VNFIFYSITNDFENFHRRREIEAIANDDSKGKGRVIYFNPPLFFIRRLFSNSRKGKCSPSGIKILDLYTLIPMTWAMKSDLLLLLFVSIPAKLQTWYAKKRYFTVTETITWFYKPNQYLYLKSLKPYVYLHYDNYKGDESYSYSKNENFDETLECCISNSLLTLVCSAKLFENFKRNNSRVVHYYPNAISRKLLKNNPSHNHSNKNEKVIGFIGQLDQSFDVELLDKIAHNFSDYQIRLIGPVTNEAIFEIAANHLNIELVGYVAYENLSFEIKKFSIGICPYAETPFNQYRNPLKISEYFSYGIPVVSVECDIDKRAREMVGVASNHNEFVELLMKELTSDNNDKAKKRKSFVENNCWDNRASFIVSEIKKIIVENNFN